MADESPAPPPRPAPDYHFERLARRRGARVVAGVDEVGRGPLAGPVVVAAVVLDPRRIPEGINDSKLLSPTAREALHDEIVRKAIVSVAVAPPAVIARLNILHASLWAMRRAVLGLAVAADYVLVDGNMLPKEMPCEGRAVVGGDGMVLSIAAASIVAKVTRDRMCAIMDCDEPHYGFAGHKGYSAPVHLKALEAHGPGIHHRMDFARCAASVRVPEAA